MNNKNVYLEAYKRKLKQTKDKKIAKMFVEACLRRITKEQYIADCEDKEQLANLSKLFGLDLWDNKKLD